MTDQHPVHTIAQAAFVAGVLARAGQGDALTPLTVRVHDTAGEVTYPGEPVHYAVTHMEYDRERGEHVLVIDQSAPVADPCTYTFSHTRHWCGNPRCRES